MSSFHRRMLRATLLFLGIALAGSAAWSQPKNQVALIEREWSAGAAAMDTEKYGEAIAHFNRVLDILNSPEISAGADQLAAAYRSRGDAHYELYQWKLAVNDYDKAIHHDAKDAQAYAFRGIARKALGDYEGLIADEEKAAALDPEYASILDDARSTVLWRRVLVGFFVLGGAVLALGIVPFFKALVRLGRAEKQNKAQ